MSVTSTAKRRRRSAKILYRDMPPSQRPHYRKRPRAKAGMRAREAMARGWKG